jgi:hypothetical protein
MLGRVGAKGKTCSARQCESSGRAALSKARKSEGWTVTLDSVVVLELGPGSMGKAGARLGSKKGEARVASGWEGTWSERRPTICERW